MSEPNPVPESVRCTLLVGAVAAIVVLAVTSRFRDACAGSSELALEVTRPAPVPARPAEAAEDRRLRWLAAPLVETAPVTCDVETRPVGAVPGSGARRRFVRAAGVVVVTSPPPKGEWFFQQNRVAPAHFDALQVDRDDHVLRRHPHSDLLERGIASTWSGLAQLGVEPELLGRLESDGQSAEAFGLVFDHRVARAADAALALREVWWNDEWKLPLRVVRRAEGRDSAKELVQEVVAFEKGAAAGEIAPPATRFPDFEVWDEVDWIEHHEETAAAPAAAGPRR